MDKNTQGNYPGRWWKKLEGKTILCELCPRHCKMHEGQRGFCFVRQNINGEMVLTTYGRSSGFCVDPVEKKPLNHFYPGTSILSFGTAGCNLGCKFCQNWDISKSREFDRLTEEASPLAIARCAKQLGCKSVAFTYNDPVIFAEYAIDIAKECRTLGIKTVAVTAGYISECARKEFYEYMDAANVDLKGFTEDFYKNITLGSLEAVLSTLKFLKHETNVWFEITTLLIPGENDAEEEIDAMSRWIFKELGPDVPLHFTAFHPDYRMMDHPSTPALTLTRSRNIAMRNGLHYVYTGNVHDIKGGSTYCPQCKEMLIERNWYVLGKYAMSGKNKCAKCGCVIPGHFDEAPGHWGAKRLPVSLAYFKWTK
jgi:pyruvate formate lyase activating enzyme